MERFKDMIDILGLHELIALVAFLITLFVWAATLSAMFGRC
jgi:hypothetical protein